MDRVEKSPLFWRSNIEDLPGSVNLQAPCLIYHQGTICDSTWPPEFPRGGELANRLSKAVPPSRRGTSSGPCIGADNPMGNGGNLLHLSPCILGEHVNYRHAGHKD
jgi:hypothetical protein